jgi:uncharacterized protein YjbI with pentapeptide repeats
MDSKVFKALGAAFSVLTLSALAWAGPLYNRGADVRERDFNHVDAPESDFYGSTGSGAKFVGANLFHSNFYGSTMVGADFSYANLSQANCYGANFQSVRLFHANIQGANFYGADLRGAELNGADARGASFYGADLRGTNFRNMITDDHTNFSGSHQ